MISKQEKKNRKELGDKLRQTREKMDFTQAEVAEKTGITVNYYAMIERGEVNPSLSKVRKLLNVLKINPSKIF